MERALITQPTRKVDFIVIEADRGIELYRQAITFPISRKSFDKKKSSLSFGTLYD